MKTRWIASCCVVAMVVWAARILAQVLEPVDDFDGSETNEIVVEATNANVKAYRKTIIVFETVESLQVLRDKLLYQRARRYERYILPWDNKLAAVDTKIAELQKE